MIDIAFRVAQDGVTRNRRAAVEHIEDQLASRLRYDNDPEVHDGLGHHAPRNRDHLRIEIGISQ